jgi:hypothetical protein
MRCADQRATAAWRQGKFPGHIWQSPFRFIKNIFIISAYYRIYAQEGNNTRLVGDTFRTGKRHLKCRKEQVTHILATASSWLGTAKEQQRNELREKRRIAPAATAKAGRPESETVYFIP